MGSSSYIDVGMYFYRTYMMWLLCTERRRGEDVSQHTVRAAATKRQNKHKSKRDERSSSQDESLRTSTHTRTRPTDGLGYESYIQHPYRRGRTWRSAGEGRNEWMLDYNYRPINLIAVQSWGVWRGGATIDASKVIGGRLTRRRRWARLSQRTHLLGADGEEI